jgi:hypothetical protein
MLRFENRHDFVEVDLVSRETADLPSQGDVYLSIRISSAGFVGHNNLWVLGRAIHEFCQALIGLERDLCGEAVLESIMPKELRLIVRSIDSRGHMLVEGSTGYEVQRENSRPRHSVTFGFEFDPSQLGAAGNVEWVQRIAEAQGPTNK